MVEQSEYIRDKLVEKKGKMKWDKYVQRNLRLRPNGILEYWTVQSMDTNGAVQESTFKSSINLVEEGLNEVKANKNKGTLFKFGWQLQTDGRTYLFTSSNDQERKGWIKQIQDTYTKAVVSQQSTEVGQQQQQQQDNKQPRKSWGAAFKGLKDTAKAQGMGAAFKTFNKDAQDIKAQNFRARKQSKYVTATLDTSSIFGCYALVDESKQEVGAGAVDEKNDGVDNQHPLMTLTLDELLRPGVPSYEAVLGSEASRFHKTTSFHDDLVVSNEFCQLALGKGLISHGHAALETSGNDEKKHIGKTYQVNKRPKDAMSDDEDDEKPEDEDALPVPQVRHDGTLREKIEFHPGSKDFTICCEIFCENLNSGNTILSNRMNGEGVEIIAPRKGSRRVAVGMEGTQGNGLLNVGKTELFQEQWYHITVVCKRANTDDAQNLFQIKRQDTSSLDNKKSVARQFNPMKYANMSGKEMMEQMTGKATIKAAATDFAVYLNGVADGKLSLDGAPDIDTLECRVGSNVEMTMSSCFQGHIKNLLTFDRALNENEIYAIARQKDNMSFSEPTMVSYVPESLTVQIPTCNIKYNGPIHRELPEHLQFQPAIHDSFTVCAYILCSRAVSRSGSVILSNLTTSGNGFELVCPTKGANVIGVQCTGTKGLVVPLGTTTIEKNRFYHIAITASQVVTYGEQPDQTVFVAYVNGKQDGSWTQNVIYKYGAGVWTVGYNGHYKQDTRFEGSISNVRLFQRALVESEIACMYAADLRERAFERKQSILYVTAKNTAEDEDQDEEVYQSNQQCTFFEDLKWEPGTFLASDMYEGKVTILDKNGAQKSLSLNEVIKPPTEISGFVPGTDAETVVNLGGMINGADFEGNTWRIYSSETQFLRHITSPSCFTLLTKLMPFPKHPFALMLENEQIENAYILNRLLYAAHELLKRIQVNKTLWTYFNEYILPWPIWRSAENFAALQKVASRLQEKYKRMQFELFDELKKQHWNVFDIKNRAHEQIENRQDGFEGGLTIEIDPDLVNKALCDQYDKQVASMILWGRCWVLNDAFQQFMKNMFSTDDGKYEYHAGPPKTYERMVEKTVEYQSEGARFPAAYRICDVLRCSIQCETLNDVADAFNVLNENITIVRVKNRFLIEFDSKETDGYRDMLINVLFSDDKGSKLSAICEVQLQLKAYLQIKKKQHKYYKIVRAVDYKSLLRNYEARKFD